MLKVSLTKNCGSHLDFFWELVFLKKSLPKFAEDLCDTAKLQDLVTFTEEIPNGKLYFLCSVTVQ